jgi:hypothetical protein
MRKLLVILNAMLRSKIAWQTPALASSTATLSRILGALTEHGCCYTANADSIPGKLHRLCRLGGPEMLAAEFVEEIFSRIRETVFRCVERLTATDIIILVIAALTLLGVYEVLGNNINSLARGFDGSLTAH